MHERKREPNLWTNKIMSERENDRGYLSVCLCVCAEEHGYVCINFTYTHIFKSSRAFCMHSLYILCVVCTAYTIYLFIFLYSFVASPLCVACSSLSHSVVLYCIQKCSVLLFTSGDAAAAAWSQWECLYISMWRCCSDMLWVPKANKESNGSKMMAMPLLMYRIYIECARKEAKFSMHIVAQCMSLSLSPLYHIHIHIHRFV